MRASCKHRWNYTSVEAFILISQTFRTSFFTLHLLFVCLTDTAVKLVTSLPCTCSPTTSLISAWLPTIKILAPPPCSKSPPQAFYNSPTSSVALKETCCCLQPPGPPHHNHCNQKVSRDRALLTSCLNSCPPSRQQEPPTTLPQSPPRLRLQGALLHQQSWWRWTERRNSVAGA